MEKIYESEFLKLNTPEKFGVLKKIVSGDAELIQDINSKDIEYIESDIKLTDIGRTHIQFLEENKKTNYIEKINNRKKFNIMKNKGKIKSFKDYITYQIEDISNRTGYDFDYLDDIFYDMLDDRDKNETCFDVLDDLEEIALEHDF